MLRYPQVAGGEAAIHREVSNQKGSVEVLNVPTSGVFIDPAGTYQEMEDRLHDIDAHPDKYRSTERGRIREQASKTNIFGIEERDEGRGRLEYAITGYNSDRMVENVNSHGHGKIRGDVSRLLSEEHFTVISKELYDTTAITGGRTTLFPAVDRPRAIMAGVDRGEGETQYFAEPNFIKAGFNTANQLVHEYLERNNGDLTQMNDKDFSEMLAQATVVLGVTHPFMDGNGRRIDAALQDLARAAGRQININPATRQEMTDTLERWGQTELNMSKFGKYGLAANTYAKEGVSSDNPIVGELSDLYLQANNQASNPSTKVTLREIRDRISTAQKEEYPDLVSRHSGHEASPPENGRPSLDTAFKEALEKGAKVFANTPAAESGPQRDGETQLPQEPTNDTPTKKETSKQENPNGWPDWLVEHIKEVKERAKQREAAEKAKHEKVEREKEQALKQATEQARAGDWSALDNLIEKLGPLDKALQRVMADPTLKEVYNQRAQQKSDEQKREWAHQVLNSDDKEGGIDRFVRFMNYGPFAYAEQKREDNEKRAKAEQVLKEPVTQKEPEKDYWEESVEREERHREWREREAANPSYGYSSYGSSQQGELHYMQGGGMAIRDSDGNYISVDGGWAPALPESSSTRQERETSGDAPTELQPFHPDYWGRSDVEHNEQEDQTLLPPEQQWYPGNVGHAGEFAPDDEVPGSGSYINPQNPFLGDGHAGEFEGDDKDPLSGSYFGENNPIFGKGHQQDQTELPPEQQWYPPSQQEPMPGVEFANTSASTNTTESGPASSASPVGSEPGIQPEPTRSWWDRFRSAEPDSAGNIDSTIPMVERPKKSWFNFGAGGRTMQETADKSTTQNGEQTDSPSRGIEDATGVMPSSRPGPSETSSPTVPPEAPLHKEDTQLRAEAPPESAASHRIELPSFNNRGQELDLRPVERDVDPKSLGVQAYHNVEALAADLPPDRAAEFVNEVVEIAATAAQGGEITAAQEAVLSYVANYGNETAEAAPEEAAEGTTSADTSGGTRS